MEPVKPHIPFGKYKGLDLDDVPADYLLWLGEQDWLEDKFPEVADYIVKERASLREEAKQDKEHATQRREEGFDEY